MPVKDYGVLKGKAQDTKHSKDAKHLEVLIQDSNEIKYRIAINVASQACPSEVLYFASENFNSEEITQLPELPDGFTRIRNNTPDIGIDFIRGNLFDSKQMIPLPNQEAGPDNDLYEKLSNYIQKAIDEEAVVYAFGDIWENEDKEDQYFHFHPGNGIHDIHMNQGNLGKWKRDDGIWQDGALLIHFEKQGKWVGIFLAFQSQSWCTDEQGHAIKSVEECNYTGEKIDHSNQCAKKENSDRPKKGKNNKKKRKIKKKKNQEGKRIKQREKKRKKRS